MTNNMNSRTAWEGDVIDIVAEALEVTHSDATGIVDAQAFRMAQAWARGDGAKAAAESVIAEGEPPAPAALYAGLYVTTTPGHAPSRLTGMGWMLPVDQDEVESMADRVARAEGKAGPERDALAEDMRAGAWVADSGAAFTILASP